MVSLVGNARWYMLVLQVVTLILSCCIPSATQRPLSQSLQKACLSVVPIYPLLARLVSQLLTNGGAPAELNMVSQPAHNNSKLYMALMYAQKEIVDDCGPDLRILFRVFEPETAKRQRCEGFQQMRGFRCHLQ